MVQLAARGLARLLALLLTTALAVAGVAVAVFSIQGEDATLSLPRLAKLVRLDDLDVSAGELLSALEADGPVAAIAGLAGAGAIVLGLIVLYGVLARRRERLVVMRSNADGTIAARPRALGQAAEALGEQSRDVLRASTKTTARRRGNGGRLCLTVYHAQSADGTAATAAGNDRVRALAESFALRLRVRSRTPRHGARVS
jgi:hypothetical protein